MPEKSEALNFKFFEHQTKIGHYKPWENES